MRPHDMVTYMGHAVWFDKPHLTYIDAGDIKRSMSTTRRFVGSTDSTTLQHLAFCIWLLQKWWEHLQSTDTGTHKAHSSLIIQLAHIASHDFHETYVQDLPHGLKKFLPEYESLELNWEKRVGDALGLPHETRNDEIRKWIDRRSAHIEALVCGHPASQYILIDRPIEDQEKVALREIYNTPVEKLWIHVWRTTIAGCNLIKEYITNGS